MNRRQAIKMGIASLLASWPLSSAQATPPPNKAPSLDDLQEMSPISVILPDSYRPLPTGKQGIFFENRLSWAVLDFMRSQYGKGRLPVWKKKFNDVDLKKRIPIISHLVVQSVNKHKSVYPVDPAWIMAQIMAESFFCEYAVSPALAVGLCQFIAPTAHNYDMLCATDLDTHFKPPYKKYKLAGAQKNYYALRKEHKQLTREYRTLFRDPRPILQKALQANVRGQKMSGAATYIQVLQKSSSLKNQIRSNRKKFQKYLRANILGRSIFNKQDLKFINSFDQRATYEKPLDSMVLMLARHLKQRHGNIIAAAAGYNAGLGNTVAEYGVYKLYGKLPTFNETVNYISRIFVNHHEIVKRMT